MNTEEKNKEIDINEVAITLEVDSEVIAKVRSGEITHILMDISEDNQNLVLETVDGNLILVTDKMPTTFHGCYLYNNGEFPYAIKNSLSFLVLSSGDSDCITRIIDVDTMPGTRFNYQGAGKPIVEDADGDSCIWEVSFEVVPVPAEAKTYLMRWNPSISSFKEKNFEECVENMVHGMFRMNWSIYEWEEARRGDLFFMMRVGDDKAGIVFSGQFISDPYPLDDWAGTNKRRMYVDMIVTNSVEPGEKPFLSLEELQQAIPELEWAKGHSGVLLSDEIIDALVELLDKE
ncbi:MAG: hypothetical protein J5545_12770 [Bacteroidaceae bacterium]|nr:hypothetical protein [Bacteroidaceae bacterium]